MDGQRLRRLACDRCRAQKLKCVRSDVSEACQRCTSANTHCSFRGPPPSGRTPTTRPFESRPAAGGRLPKAKSLSQRNSTAASLSLDIHPTRHDLAQGSWPRVTNWEEDDLFYLLNEEMDAGEIHTPSFENWSATTPKIMDEFAARQNVWQSGDADRYPPAMNTEATNTLAAQHPPWKPTAAATTNIEQDKRQQWSGYSTGPSSTSTLTESSEQPQPYNRPTLMQKLMQLGVAMYEIQSTYSVEKPGSRSLPCETFPADLAGKVVQVATDFLKILTPLSDSVPPTSASSRSLLPSWTQASSGTSTPKRGSVTDKHTMLQLIANYLLLLQLYLILYQGVHDYLHFNESTSSHLQPIWDDLSIGSTPLFQFAEFQIKMILQVTARLLEEIEVALGLVEGCRVSTKSANEGDGILGINGTAQFIKMCTSEISTVVEPSGRGAIIRLQELTDSLTTTLNGPVSSLNISAR